MKQTENGTFVLSGSSDSRLLDSLLADLTPDFELGFDVETKTTRKNAKAPDPQRDALVGVGLGIYNSHTSEALPVYFLADDDLLRICRNRLPEIGWYAHNAMFDATVVRRYGIRLGKHLGDPRIIAYLLGEPEAGLKRLLERWMAYETTEYHDLLDEWGAQDISEVPVEVQADYCALQDAVQCVILAHEMEPQLPVRSLDVYRKIELPMVEILVEMSHEGIVFDRAAAEPLYIQECQARDGLDDVIASLVAESGFSEVEKRNGEIWHPTCKSCRNGRKKKEGCTACRGRGKGDPVVVRFNPGSPDQLRRWLYDHMSAPVRRYAGGVKPGWQLTRLRSEGVEVAEGTDSLALLQLREFHPVIPLIISRRKIAKRASFLGKWLELSAEDGRLHTMFTNTTVVSGRLSSRNPNLQQVTLEFRHLFRSE